MGRLVRGVGAMDLPGESRFPSAGPGRRGLPRPAYKAWENMLRRAYCAKYRANNPSYEGVTVCPEWLTFSVFKAWWDGNHVDGWQLDKDLLGDSRQYGPDACIYIPGWLNSFINGNGKARGEWPTGVCWVGRVGRFKAVCRHPCADGQKGRFLGLFDCPQEAHEAWKARKLEIAAELKPRMDEIDARIYPRVVAIIERML